MGKGDDSSHKNTPGKQPPHDEPARPPIEPVDIIDGIPDRAAARPAWKYILLAAIFILWLALLLLLYRWGKP